LNFLFYLLNYLIIIIIFIYKNKVYELDIFIIKN
jgi:hypothetical protein